MALFSRAVVAGADQRPEILGRSSRYRIVGLRGGRQIVLRYSSLDRAVCPKCAAIVLQIPALKLFSPVVGVVLWNADRQHRYRRLDPGEALPALVAPGGT